MLINFGKDKLFFGQLSARLSDSPPNVEGSISFWSSARQGGALYDKFVGFVEDMINLGRQMDTAKKTYATSMNKLTDGRGNLVRSAEKIRELGAKLKKKLPPALIDRMDDTDALNE